MQVSKRGLCPNARAELWRRWRAGQTLSDIARALAKPPGSIFGFVVANGGIAPTPRKRRVTALSLLEREEISRGLSRSESFNSIAARLNRSVSTISREVARNSGAAHYRGADADEAMWRRARRPKRCKLAENRRLQQ